MLANVHEVRDALRARGDEAELVPVRLHDFRWLARCRKADLVYNLCEGINGHARYEDAVVHALELAGVPFTGCRAWPIVVCHRKHVANTLLAAHGIPVPGCYLAGANKLPADVPLPAIVKPNAEDASVGIDGGAVCSTRRALRQRVAQMLEQFEEVIVQRYVAGREVNVGFVGREVLPISEISFEKLPEGQWPIVTYAAKWVPGSPDDLGTEPQCPARLPADVQRRAVAVARQAWEHLCGAEGYGRVDMRIDDDGQPWVIEVNPCPDLSSDAGLARMARARGWAYEELVCRIADEALARSRQQRAAAQLTTGQVPA
ncbi:MAG: ATP-grasp domain-containing protein [Gemmatimonadales bacterium]|nr:ATP-grasp domain-containing protein [Gemmatimonadales bacterium]